MQTNAQSKKQLPLQMFYISLKRQTAGFRSGAAVLLKQGEPFFICMLFIAIACATAFAHLSKYGSLN